MKLVYGTTNAAKLQFMKRRVRTLEVEILSLADVGAPEPDIDESGESPLENARIKAHAYYSMLGMPVFSCDSGLYIEGLDSARQPGAFIRGRGNRMDDSVTTKYYSSLAAELGGSMAARYHNAICLVLDNNHVYEYSGDGIASDRFLIVDKPHAKRNEGFPIDCLSVHIESGKYYYDIDGYGEKYYDGCYAEFFEKSLLKWRRVKQG